MIGPFTDFAINPFANIAIAPHAASRAFTCLTGPAAP